LREVLPVIRKDMTLKEYMARAKAKKANRKARGKLIWSAKPKPSRSAVVKKLDAVFSLYIRARDKRVANGLCVLCRKRPIEVCFHWISRGAFATRWDEANCVGSCSGCNYEETFRKQKYRDMHIQLVGVEVREAMEAKAREAVHIPTAELEAKIRHFKGLLESGRLFFKDGVADLLRPGDEAVTK